MKVRLILSLIAALFVAGSVFASGPSNRLSDRFDGLDVVLKGEVGTETNRSIPIIPIEALVGDDGFVHIQFNEALGAVEILVDGELQESCQVDAANQETAFSVLAWESGVYKLEFKTPEGGYVYGEFVVE